MLLLLSTAMVDSAAAGALGCGSTITTSTTLDHDVGPCPGDGLIVAADDITLRLNGHRVYGQRPPGTPAGGQSVGIRLLRVKRVTVTGPGTVERFAAGVAIYRGSANVVRNLTSQDNIGPLGGQNLGDGIVLINSNGTRVSEVKVRRNGPFDGIGIFGASSRNRISGSTIVDNAYVDPTTGSPPQDFGVKIEGPGATKNMVLNNQISGNGADGVVVTSSCVGFPGTDTCEGSPQNADNVIAFNLVTGNGVSDAGVSVGAGPGPGSGINLFNLRLGPMPPPVPPVRTLIKGNTVRANAGNGINIDEGSSNNTITGNVATGNNTSHTLLDFDARDNNRPDCDSNTWSDNYFGTYNLPCVNGGRPAP